MTDKIDLWPLIYAWLNQSAPALYATGLSFGMAVLRILYAGETHRRMLVDGMICSGMTLTLIGALEFFQLPQNMAVFFGGCIGFLGVEKIRLLVNRYVDGMIGRGRIDHD